MLRKDLKKDVTCKNYRKSYEIELCEKLVENILKTYFIASFDLSRKVWFYICKGQILAATNDRIIDCNFIISERIPK